MTKRDVDWILIEALVSGKSQREAARMADVSEKTVQRRRKDHDFKVWLAQRRLEQQHEVAERAADRLVVSATVAVETLVDAATDSLHDRARVKAATAILEYAAQLTHWGGPSASVQPDDSSAAEDVRRRFDEMHRNLTADISVGSQPERDKTGQNC